MRATANAVAHGRNPRASSDPLTDGRRMHWSSDMPALIAGSAEQQGEKMRFGVAIMALLLLAAHAALAQSVFTGSVRDTSGAMLPGVTVEASSPALIERTRTVVTDDHISR